MVLGGAGLVGQAICRQCLAEGIQRLIVTSLTQTQSEDCITHLRQLFPEARCEMVALGGDLFAPLSLKDTPRAQRLADVGTRAHITDAVINPLEERHLKENTFYQWCQQYRPDIVIDCVNTATALAYQDQYHAGQQLREAVQQTSARDPAQLLDLTERLLLAMPMPQLIRHVQIFWQAMCEAKVGCYLKIGTSGTGGLGINLPYTHSEGSAAQLLLSKAAVAGAHTLLLFLLARTEGGPIVKEIKPAAYIGWKSIGFGPIRYRGEPIRLEDCPPESAPSALDAAVARDWTPRYLTQADGQPRVLEAPYIDTGENGMWALSEFALITDQDQMEFITPEEIAQLVAWEIQGRNTGADIVAALDNSTLGPTYRGGYMRKSALEQLYRLEETSGIDSVAFEMPGPNPAKLLYEAYLLRRCFPHCEAVLQTAAATISQQVTELLRRNQELRARILSIGLPILLPDGERLWRGSTMHIPTDNQRALVTRPQPSDIQRWANDGWIDLRPANWQQWQRRIQSALDDHAHQDTSDTSSYYARGHYYWETTPDGKHPLIISKLVSWVYRTEAKGSRMKC